MGRLRKIINTCTIKETFLPTHNFHYKGVHYKEFKLYYKGLKLVIYKDIIKSIIDSEFSNFSTYKFKKVVLWFVQSYN